MSLNIALHEETNPVLPLQHKQFLVVCHLSRASRIYILKKGSLYTWIKKYHSEPSVLPCNGLLMLKFRLFLFLRFFTCVSTVIDGDDETLGLKTDVSWLRKFICTSFCLSSGLTGEANSFWSSTAGKTTNAHFRQQTSDFLCLTPMLQWNTHTAEAPSLPSERVLTVWGSLADFIIAVKVMISVRSRRLQPVHSPLISRMRCFYRKQRHQVPCKLSWFHSILHIVYSKQLDWEQCNFSWWGHCNSCEPLWCPLKAWDTSLSAGNPGHWHCLCFLWKTPGKALSATTHYIMGTLLTGLPSVK